MNLRVLIVLSLLVGIGAVLHAVAPPVIMGVKPDMLLSMMFLGIILFPKIKYVLPLSVLTGAASALTTAVPGGQISNMIDKPITALIFLGLFLLVKDIGKRTISAPILTAIGTMISGTIFLSIILFFLGIDLDDGFLVLFTTVVLPATLINTIIMVIVYPIVQTILKRSQPLLTQQN